MEDTEGKIVVPGIGVSVFVLASTLFLGGLLLAIGYVVRRLSRSSKPADSMKILAEPERLKPEDSRIDASSGPTGTTGKRAKSKKRREAQQEFTHSWMIGALKGHTAPVLDMNFSSNGKFLASCAEDYGLRPEEEMLDPGYTDSYAGCKVKQVPPSTKQASRSKCRASSTWSTGNDASISSATVIVSADLSTSVKEDRAILSRRQRKNRSRTPRDQRHEIREDDDEPPTQQRQHRSRHSHCSTRRSEPNPTTVSRRNSMGNQTLMSSHPEENKTLISIENGADRVYNYTKYHPVQSLLLWQSPSKKVYHVTLASVFAMLRAYTLGKEQREDLGYPVECSICPGRAYIMILQKYPFKPSRNHRLDANAQEFVPSNRRTWQITESEGDSGHCSGTSVDSSDLEQESSSDSDNIGESSTSTDSSSWTSSSYHQDLRKELGLDESSMLWRECARCHQSFRVYMNGEYVNHQETCVHHWGKFRNGRVENAWECCSGRANARGCTTARNHVWTGLREGLNGPYINYVRTIPARTVPKDGNYGIYALDCEMCFTKQGLELARVTVVNMSGDIVYDTLVRPMNHVIDYNTRFSGITAEVLSQVWKTLADVQNDLTSFIHAETILIGHGLENDLRALRLLHTTVIDTCVVFPHYRGYPYRNSLKTLARTVLWRDIQLAEHDSVEDARIVVDLMLRRLELDHWHQ